MENENEKVRRESIELMLLPYNQGDWSIIELRSKLYKKLLEEQITKLENLTTKIN